MKFLIILSLLIFGATQVQAMQKRCGSEDVSADTKLMVTLQTGLFSRTHSASSFTIANSSPSIPVYFHVMTGGVSESVIEEQMNILEQAYAYTNFNFELMEVNFLPSDNQWQHISKGSVEELEMKSSLRKGGRDALNIYVTNIVGSFLGWSAFPWDAGHSLEADGVVIQPFVLPGGHAPYNLGQTLTHEVGHWFGLFHTFHGGCDGDGDFVADTPAETAPSYGCPTVAAMSCDGKEPVSIHNFMNYSDDICLSEFTPMQIDRAHASFDTFRGGQIFSSSMISTL